MINRRLIRIKSFQKLYTHFMNEEELSHTIAIETKKSILGMEQNTLGVLAFLPKLSVYLFQEHNPSEYKYQPTSEDLKSFKLFTDNLFVNEMEKLERFKRYSDKPTIDWNSDKEVMFSIYKGIKESNFYKLALLGEQDLKSHADFAKNVYKYLIFESVDFELFMEQHNIYWYDEKIPVLKSIERLFDDFAKGNSVILPQFSKSIDEDIQMAEDLIEAYIANKEEITKEIDKYTPGWESERITKIDYILMSMALTEFRYLDMIPVKVTLNEYIEIAKMYSTPKSSRFLNGTLDKILQDWTEAGTINKRGRGLIG